ncbi:partial putative deoxyribonuclease RhsA, partial [Myxococcaceae bacterium]
MRPLAAVLAVLWLSAATVAAQASPELQPDAPDVVLSVAITEKAAELGNDPVHIYEFVRNEIEYQPYYGLMKGPESTLHSGAGNEYDLAALLVSLLRASGTPARFVRGRIRVTYDQAMGWTGATSASGAFSIWRYSQPIAWPEFGQGANTRIRVWQDTAASRIEKLHVWVEAEIPLARYRGSGSDARGRAWVPLDPSYKLRDWNIDPGYITGSMPEIALNYTGTDGYYRSINPKLPVEVFADQYRAHLAAQHPQKTLAEVVFGGPVRVERAGVIPTALPYELGSSLPVMRSPSLEALHQAETPDPKAGVNGAADYRFSWSIYVCTAAATDCVANNDATRILTWESQWTAALDGRRVTLSFPPAPGFSPPAAWKGYETCDGLSTRPTIRVDGQQQTAAGVVDVPVCTGIRFHAVTRAPFGFLFATVGQNPLTNAYVQEAGGTYLLALDAHGASAAHTQIAANDLARAEKELHLAEDVDGSPFLDTDDDGTKDPGEPYLGADFDAQDALVGGLLHLAGVRFMELVRAGESKASSFYHRLRLRYPASALLSSGRTSMRIFGTPFYVRPSNLLIDAKGFAGGTVQRDGTIVQTFEAASELASHNNSAAEHSIWEEVAAAEAVSTVKGFQIQYSHDQDLLHVKCAPGDIQSCRDQARVIRAQAGCSTFYGGCTNLDLASYCELYRSWPNTDMFQPVAWYQSCGSHHLGNTFDLRIPRFARFQYGDQSAGGWDGYVFVRISSLGGAGVSTEFAITPCSTAYCGGGYVVRSPYVSPAINPSLANRFFGYDPAIFGRGLTNSWATNAVTAKDPVSVVTGNNQHIETDLEIAGRGGMNLRLVRSYNSRLEYDGPLGYGWTHTYDQHLRRHGADTPADPDDDRVVWLNERGEEVPFDDPTGLSGVLTPDKGIHHRLVRESDGSFTLTLKEGPVYRFLTPGADGKARLSTIRDRNGNEIACRYDAAGMLEAVIDTAGRELTFVNANGHLSRIEDWTRTPGGQPDRVWTYTVDSLGDLTAYLDPEQKAAPGGRPTIYRYTSGYQEAALNHNLQEIILPADRDSNGEGDVAMKFVYYSNDTVYSHTNSLGETTYFSFNFFRKRTTVTSPDGTTEAYIFDAYGNTTRYESARGVVHEYEFETATRNRIREVDGNGHALTAEYDAAGNMVRRVDRLGRAERWSYDSFGQPTSHRDRRGHQRQWQYDAKGNLVREYAEVDGALRTLREHAWDSFGNQIATTEYANSTGANAQTNRFEIHPVTKIGAVRITDALGRETRLTLDALGRATRAERMRASPSRAVQETVAVETAYDRLGRVVAVTDPAGVKRETAYDANGLVETRRTRVPQPGGTELVRTEETNTYDDADRLVATRNALDEETRFAYDAQGRVVERRSPLGNVSRVEYDADGQAIAATDATGATTRTEYDGEGRVVRSIDALGAQIRTSYDAEGRVLAVTQYDAAGTLLRTLRSVLPEDLDEEGHAKSVRDASGHRTDVVYDELGRPRSVTTPVGTAEESTTGFEYDLQGRLLARTDGEGHTLRVRYDVLGRVIEATDALGRSTTFGYDE